MLEKKTKQYLAAFQKLIGPIETCKICFCETKINSIRSFIYKRQFLCTSCLNELNPKFINFDSNGIKCLAIYEYDEKMKDMIYQFKGCFDYELKDLFVNYYAKELSFLFRGYVVVPAPSFFEDNIKRGFNHVEEIFKNLKLEMVDAFEKTSKFKQAEHGSEERKKISNYLRLKNDVNLKDRKVLLVDDIYTTGSTINAMISVLKSVGIKEIKGLVICKTRLK